MTFREIIQMAGELRPHSFSENVLLHWLTALDGRIAAAVFLMAPEEYRQRKRTHPQGLDNEPLVEYPHQEMYVQYLIAQIDLALGENEQYQNDMAVYNESYSDFVRWFGNRYAPAQGYGKGCRCGCGPDGNPPYYLTAYGLAVQQGFRGSLAEWLQSLNGDNVELSVEGSVLRYRSVGPDGSTGEWIVICDLRAFAPDLNDAIDLLQEALQGLAEKVAVAPSLVGIFIEDPKELRANKTADEIHDLTYMGVSPVFIKDGWLYGYVGWRPEALGGHSAVFERVSAEEGMVYIDRVTVDDEGSVDTEHEQMQAGVACKATNQRQLQEYLDAGKPTVVATNITITSPVVISKRKAVLRFVGDGCLTPIVKGIASIVLDAGSEGVLSYTRIENPRIVGNWISGDDSTNGSVGILIKSKGRYNEIITPKIESCECGIRTGGEYYDGSQTPNVIYEPYFESCRIDTDIREGWNISSGLAVGITATDDGNGNIVLASSGVSATDDGDGNIVIGG